MATSVTLPALGESVTEGTVTRWLKQPGDQVAVDEPLLEVSTDKVDTEIPSPVAGTLLEIKVQEDETIEVGAELATIGDEGESGGESGGTTDEGESAPEGQPAAQQPAEGQPAEQGASESGRQPQSEAAPSEDAAPKQTEPQGDVPAAQTEPTPPPQETAPGSADTKPETESSQAGTGMGGTSVTLPALGESVTEGTVTRWLKQVGDDVAVDEPLLEVSTDKVDTEIPSPVAGKLLDIKVQEDETVEVGAELAVIGSGAPSTSASAPSGGGDQTQQAAEAPAPTGDGAPSAGSQADASQTAPSPEPAPAAARQVQPDAGAESDKAPAPDAQKPAQAPAPQPAPQPAQQQAQPTQQQASGDGSGDGAYVTPLVRKMAADQGVDLAAVTGTGVGGRIRKQDVLEAAKAQKEAKPAEAAPRGSTSGGGAPAAAGPPSPLRGKTEPLTRLRKVIAKRMVESLQTSAQLTTVVEVDVTTISRLRDAAKADFANREGVKLSFLPFFAKAAIDALKAAPVAERRDRHREGRGHLLRPREPLDRGGHREGPADAGHQGRR